MKSRILSVSAALIIVAAAFVAYAQDAAKSDAKHYKVEVDNARVRVLRVHYGPHEKSTMHTHPDAVAIFLTDSNAKFTMADGKTMNMPMKAGQAVWTPATKHLPENLGDKPFELILVELKK